MARLQEFGPYTLIERVAVGGMAEIFLARKRGTHGFHKYYAVKRLHPQYSADQQFVDMLIDEAKITVQLEHPNIIDVHDLGQLDGHFYMALGYVNGHDLFQVLKTLQTRGRFMPVETAVFVTQEILSGLHYAHMAADEEGRPLNIIHRDISPQNILVSYEGEVKLTDFGIVKAERRLTETASGVIKGKFYYMSPEQAKAEAIDHRSDLFSAGIVLYESLVAAPLYDDEDDSGKLLARVQKAEIAPPSTQRGDIPPGLERVIMRSLHPNPDERYQTALEFHRALSETLREKEHSYNRMDFALYLRQLLPPEKGRDKRQLVQEEKEHLKARAIAKEQADSPKPGVLLGRGIRKENDGGLLRSETQVSSVLVEPFDPRSNKGGQRPGEQEREEMLRLALAAVILAILLVSAAIVYVIRSSPEPQRAEPISQQTQPIDSNSRELP